MTHDLYIFQITKKDYLTKMMKKGKTKNIIIHWSGKTFLIAYLISFTNVRFFSGFLHYFTHTFMYQFRLVLGLLKVTKKQEEKKKKNITLDILQPSRYKPNDLEQMAKDTRFTKEEVRYLYRAFKQECPNGIVDEETFKDVYEKIFPLGDASHYAHLVFAAIDR